MALISFTLALSASLLFALELMLGKMLLPFFGGAPHVWIVCMLFFQGLLLAAYCWSEFLIKHLRLIHQVLLQGALILCTLTFFLPNQLDPNQISLDTTSKPTSSLLWMLFHSSALPFFALAGLAPLLQHWFSESRRRDSESPYFLYAASNLGSLIGLLLYPLVLERKLELSAQFSFWQNSFVLLAVMLAAVGLHTVIRTARVETQKIKEAPGQKLNIPYRTQLNWIILSTVPCSLSLGLTGFISSNIAPFPLLWVIPLALYLLTFVMAFSRVNLRAPTWSYRALCLMATVTLLATVLERGSPIGLIVGLNLISFFLAAWICHSRLAISAPAAHSLARFYLCIAFGGFFGGVFNACLAPLIFSNFIEYPLALAVSTILAGYAGSDSNRTALRESKLVLVWGVFIFAVLTAGIFFAHSAGLGANSATLAFICAIPFIINYSALKNSACFGTGLVALVISGSMYQGILGQVLTQERNFFGVVRTSIDHEQRYYQMIHGSTLHGRQARDKMQECIPLTYYHRSGPIGEILSSEIPAQNVGVIGLGAGSLACYAKTGTHWKFFEINPAVVDSARDQRYFTLLKNSKAGELDIVLGDGRLTLLKEPDQFYDVLILDAFSSDSIPLHLLTREAMALYLKKLKPDGIILMHISNLYLRLEPVVRGLAAAEDLTLCLNDDTVVTPEFTLEGKMESEWAMFIKRGRSCNLTSGNWQELQPASHELIWTDSYSNIVPLIRW